ncbi:MAG: DivIVA domain-containing protein [Candidatus Zixiibacteriota bacterium]
MDLTPSDIRNYEFSTQMRGYDKEEVDSLLDQTAVALEQARQENLKLSMQIDSLNTQLSGLRQFEETIKSAAIDARRNADMTVANAKQEAELILSKAKAESEKLVGSHEQQLGKLERQIAQIEATKRSYLSKLRNLISSHLELIEEQTVERAQPNSGSTDPDVEITDSSEIERSVRETVATQPSEKTITTEETNAASAVVAVNESDSAEPSDPDLLAAIGSYRRQDNPPDDTKAQPDPAADIPAQGEMVETSALAEDIPPGFVPKEESKIDESTDKMKVAASSSAIIGKTKPDLPAESPQDYADISKELDKVAARFEEEIDKADKS